MQDELVINLNRKFFKQKISMTIFLIILVMSFTIGFFIGYAYYNIPRENFHYAEKMLYRVSSPNVPQAWNFYINRNTTLGDIRWLYDNYVKDKDRGNNQNDLNFAAYFAVGIMLDKICTDDYNKDLDLKNSTPLLNFSDMFAQRPEAEVVVYQFCIDYEGYKNET